MAKISMRYSFYGILICLLATFSCTKKDQPGMHPPGYDNGCIELLRVPVTGQIVSSADIHVINSVFEANNIDNSKLHYFHYLHDSLNGADYKVVKAEQYLNSLRIFTGQLVFEFKNDMLHFKAGLPTDGTALNAIPQLIPAQVRKLFIDDAGLFENKADQYKDSCLKAEFGYYNLNAGSSITKEVLVKAWRVSCKHQVYPVEYPLAYYKDNGSRIYYDNGISTFKLTAQVQPSDLTTCNSFQTGNAPHALPGSAGTM